MSKENRKKTCTHFPIIHTASVSFGNWDNSSLADVWINNLKSEKCIHVIICKCKTANMGQHLNSQEK